MIIQFLKISFHLQGTLAGITYLQQLFIVMKGTIVALIQYSASNFPHDFLSFYSAAQAGSIQPGYTSNDTKLVSQMLRVNYSYNNRYLLTLTGRRDGYSGFGSQKKYGVFPSVALGWNAQDEDFFPFKDIFNRFKVRASWGLNGNQAVGAYESISRLGSNDYVNGESTVAGYTPSVLGQDELGWETSSTLNFGIDFGILNDRISGEIECLQNQYHRPAS